MRIRIALATAVAVCFIIPAVLFALFSSASSASTRATRHTAASQQRTSISTKLMSYSQAQRVSKLVTYSNAVEQQKEVAYLGQVASLKAEAAQQANTIPSAWVATATCEEGGRDDPYAGYFGILAWGHFDGYPTAGSAPLSVQLAWEAAHGQGPPDAPGECHSY